MFTDYLGDSQGDPVSTHFLTWSTMAQLYSSSQWDKEMKTEIFEFKWRYRFYKLYKWNNSKSPRQSCKESSVVLTRAEFGVFAFWVTEQMDTAEVSDWWGGSQVSGRLIAGVWELLSMGEHHFLRELGASWWAFVGNWVCRALWSLQKWLVIDPHKEKVKCLENPRRLSIIPGN